MFSTGNLDNSLFSRFERPPRRIILLLLYILAIVVTIRVHAIFFLY